MSLGGFFIFNALCDMLEKVTETPSAPSNQPMPKKIAVAAIAFAVCIIATFVIIALIL